MGEYLGPNYPYHKNISTPDDMGMSTKGDMETLGINIKGLINYASLLTLGDSIANKKIKNEQANIGSQQPLGDRIFVKTVGKCKQKVWDEKPIFEEVGEEVLEEMDEKERQEYDTLKEEKDEEKKNEEKKNEDKTPEEELVERHVFIDHIPTGNIPGLGNMAAMKGFIPGVMDNIFKLNPIKIIKAMGEPAHPDCFEVEFETITYKDNNEDAKKHEISTEKRWVSVKDLQGLNPCTFKSMKKSSGFPKISGITVAQGLVGNKFQHPLGNPGGSMKDGAFCHWTKGPEEGFANLFKMKNNTVRKSIINVNNKPIAKIFNASFGILLAYLLYKVLRKEL